MRRAAGWLAAAAMLGMLCLGAGFAAFVAASRASQPPPARAGGILVLTGGPDRVETALHLLADDRAGLLLISGVAPGATLADLARLAELDPAPLASRVTLGRAATTTVGNAGEAVDWVAGHDLHSVIVVTAGYHMQRALLELSRTLPGVALFPVAVHPPRAHPLRGLWVEYIKLLGAAAGVSRIVAPRPPWTPTPVDKPVHSLSHDAPAGTKNAGQAA